MLTFRPLFSSTDNTTFKSNIFCFFFALQNFNRSVSNRYAHNAANEPFININCQLYYAKIPSAMTQTLLYVQKKLRVYYTRYVHSIPDTYL